MKRRRVILTIAAALAVAGTVAGATLVRIDGPASSGATAKRLLPPAPGITLPGDVAPIDTSDPDRIIGGGTPRAAPRQPWSLRSQPVV